MVPTWDVGSCLADRFGRFCPPQGVYPTPPDLSLGLGYGVRLNMWLVSFVLRRLWEGSYDATWMLTVSGHFGFYQVQLEVLELGTASPRNWHFTGCGYLLAP